MLTSPLYDERCSIEDYGICDGGCGDTGLDTTQCVADGNDFTETAVHINRCFTLDDTTTAMYSCTSSDFIGTEYATSDCSGTPTETVSEVEDSDGCLEVVMCDGADADSDNDDDGEDVASTARSWS